MTDALDRWVCLGTAGFSTALVAGLVRSGSFSLASFLAALVLLVPVGILAYLLGFRHGWGDMRKEVREALHLVHTLSGDDPRPGGES